MDTTDQDDPIDHHQALGVEDRNATQKELKTAYYQLAKKSHPDKGGDRVVFERIAAAWEVLGNPAKRGHYDRGEQGPPSERVILQNFMSKMFPGSENWGELSKMMCHLDDSNVLSIKEPIQHELPKGLDPDGSIRRWQVAQGKEEGKATTQGFFPSGLPSMIISFLPAFRPSLPLSLAWQEAISSPSFLPSFLPSPSFF